MNATVSYMSDQRLTVASLLVLLLIPVFALAAPPHTPPGKIQATEVFDYRDYRSLAVSHREFVVTNGNGLVRIVDDLDRTVPGWLIIHRAFHDSDGNVHYRDTYLQGTDTDLLYDHEDVFSAEGTVTTAFDPPLSIRQSVMPKGAMQGGAALKEVTGPSGPISKSGITRVNAALGEDEVSVPVGPLSDCLRLYEENDGRSRVSWYCPDYGFVKRIFSDNGAIWEMDQCQGCPQPE